MGYDNNMTGVLFPNDKKGNEKAPVYKGKITFNNVEYDLAGWVNESASGKFMSLRVSEKMIRNNQSANQQSTQNTGNGVTPFPDDIPF